MPLMAMMQMMMGQNGMAGHIEAASRTRSNCGMPSLARCVRRRAIRGMPNYMSMMQPLSGTLPDKRAAHEKAMTAHLDFFVNSSG
jgi:hypothetical protein